MSNPNYFFNPDRNNLVPRQDAWMRRKELDHRYSHVFVKFWNGEPLTEEEKAALVRACYGRALPALDKADK